MRALFLPFFLLATSAFAADEAELRVRFRAAYAEARLDESLRANPLYPYLQLAQWRERLERAPAEADAGIREFLREQGDTPVAARLRKPWLLSLAARGQWKTFLDESPADTSDEVLRCHALTARIALKRQARLREAVTAAWLSGQQQPDECDPAFRWLREQNLLTDDLRRARVNLALLENQPKLAHRLAEDLPPSKTRESLLAAARLLNEPQTEFARQLAGGLPADTRLTLAAYGRLARRDSGMALSLLEPLVAQLAPEEQKQAQALAGIGLALDHRPEALDVFREAGATDNVQAQEWRLRAALWAGDWARVLEWIAALPASAQAEPRWRYWRGRALAALGRNDEARAAWGEAMQAREYYGFLAAERLEQPPRIAPLPLKQDAKLREALEQTPALVRARELFYCDLSGEAAAEFRWLLERLDAAGKAEAARQAAGWGWHWQAIPTLAALNQWDDVVLRYPLPYAEDVRRAAQESQLPVVQIYAVMRQESLYNPSALSSAGAYGLMQMLPATARRTAHKFGLPAPTTRALLDPATGLQLGALHLSELLEDFEGRWPLVYAAYNAGPRRANEWRPPAELAADVWIENIPFNETRLYVQRILAHRVLFGWRLDGKPLAMLPLLDDITPQSAADE